MGNAVYNFSRWVFLALLAKLSSPETVGQYALALALSTPVFMFSSLRLRTVQTTDVQNKYAFGDFMGLGLVASILALVVIAIILVVKGYGAETASIVALMSCAKCAEAISEIAYGNMQKQERLDVLSRSLMLKGILSLISMSVTLYISGSLALTLVSQWVVSTTVMWFYDLRMVRHFYPIQPRFEYQTLRNLFWLALPLAFVAGLGSLSIQIPRLAIEHFENQHMLGIFAAIASLGMFSAMITTALSRSVLPRLAQLFTQHKYEGFVKLIWQLVSIGMAIGVLGVIGALIFGKLFLRLAYTAEYAEYTDLLMIIMAYVGLETSLTFLGTSLAATQQFRIVAYIHIVKSIVIGIASYLLVSHSGIIGAAWAILVGTATAGPIFGLALWRTLRQAKTNHQYGASM